MPPSHKLQCHFVLLVLAALRGDSRYLEVSGPRTDPPQPSGEGEGGLAAAVHSLDGAALCCLLGPAKLRLPSLSRSAHRACLPSPGERSWHDGKAQGPRDTDSLSAHFALRLVHFPTHSFNFPD